MVVALYDNNNDTTDPGPTIVWSNTTLGTTELLTLSEATNTTAYTWTWADLYYLLDPLPGTGVISGTDSNSTFLYMQAYTLGGVDTTATPFAVGNGNGGASTLSVTTSAQPVVRLLGGGDECQLQWRRGERRNYCGGQRAGQSRTTRIQMAFNVTAGYITNLAAGASTITATGTGSPTHMDLAAEVFSPLAGTGAPTM